MKEDVRKIKLKFLPNAKNQNKGAYLGKTYRLSISSNFAKQFKIENGTLLGVAFDEDEKPLKTIYFHINHKDGFKVNFINKSYSMAFKSIAEHFNMKTEKRYKLFKIDNDRFYLLLD